jgi:hypothetical protein
VTMMCHCNFTNGGLLKAGEAVAVRGRGTWEVSAPPLFCCEPVAKETPLKIQTKRQKRKTSHKSPPDQGLQAQPKPHGPHTPSLHVP